MKVRVTGFTQGKKIQAIKAIRAATGLGLKDSKDVADAVEAGTEQEIEVPSADRLGLLEEEAVRYEIVPVQITLGAFMDVLSRYPRELPVGQILDALTPIRDLKAGSNA